MEAALNRRKQLDLALDAMLAGRNVESIDGELRDLVRLAAGIRNDREALTPERRAALKARILRRLDAATRPTLAERAALAARLLARPLPLVARAAVIVLLLASLGAGATLASADAVPDDTLYGVKLSSEQMRLALAQTPEDRAAVELTIAEHRLQESTSLAGQDRDAEADAAVSEFGEHLAVAAAYLEDAAPASSSALVAQLRNRLVQQQERLVLTSPRLAADASSSTAVTVLTEIAATIISGQVTAADSIADVAARGAERAATLADGRVPSAATIGSARPTGTRAPATATGRPASARPAATPIPPRLVAKIEAAAKSARQAAERARAAADRAKNAAHSTRPRTPAPSPTRRP